MAGITYQIDFAAQIARLVDGTQKGAASVKKMADQMESSSRFARNALASIGAGLSIAGLVAMTKSASESADAAAKAGDRFGIATEAMIGMQHAASLAGVSNDGLTTALRGLARSGVDAASGGAEATRAFERLGLQASEFIKLPMDRQISIVIDRLGGLENAAIRNATAQAILGRQAGEVMGLVAEGSEVFKQAATDTEAWGLAINRIDAAKLEMANDAMKRAQDATKGFFTQIALALSPAVAALADHFADTTAQARGYRDEISQGSEIVIQAIGYTANFIHGLQFAWMGARLAAAMALQGWVEIIAFLTDNAIARRLLGVERVEAVQGLAASMAQTVAEIKAELEAFVDLTLPADEIIARIRKVTAAMDVEAKKIAARRQSMMGGEGPELKPDDRAFDQQLAQQLLKIVESNELQLEALRRHAEAKQNVLDTSLEKGFITQEFWEAQSALTFAQYEKEKTKLLDEEIKKRYGISNVYRELDLQSASAWLGAMAGMMSSKSRAMFEVGKAAAISKTVIDTYTAAQGAYAAFSSIPYVGPALGIAAAAAAIVAGLARVQQIRSTQFGGGGGASPTYNANPVTGVPTAPISPTQTQPSQSPIQVQVIIQGNLIGNQEYVDSILLPAIADAVDNRDFQIMHPNSNNAQQIMAGA